ncbi:uncharacterized protein [Palaemon carinicauda]|uniref:uncharacterized protein isoform X2 n=1 Tax=Palaemon carinicauda TaxID=392227 RepID=UPI0035B68B53
MEERETLQQFILQYKSLPELWDTRSDGYTKKEKRETAYKKLLEVYKRIKSNGNVEDVKKKINILRSNFRKELKKMSDYKTSGATTEDVYVPSSWVFRELSFLTDLEKPISPNTTKSTMEGDGSTTEQSFTRIPLKKKIKMDKREELLTLACKRLCDTDDEYDKIASAWAAELQKMSPTQMPFAKKAINDILFEGQLGTLHRHSVVINGAMSMSTTNAAEPPDDDEMPTCSNAPSVKWTCSNTTKSDQILDLVARNLYQRYEERDSANETFGKYVGQKLDSLDTKTSSFAIKMINDVLYEAENGNLKVPL